MAGARKLYNLMEACVRECEKYETEADSRKLFEETREKMVCIGQKRNWSSFVWNFAVIYWKNVSVREKAV